MSDAILDRLLEPGEVVLWRGRPTWPGPTQLIELGIVTTIVVVLTVLLLPLAAEAKLMTETLGASTLVLLLFVGLVRYQARAGRYAITDRRVIAARPLGFGGIMTAPRNAVKGTVAEPRQLVISLRDRPGVLVLTDLADPKIPLAILEPTPPREEASIGDARGAKLGCLTILVASGLFYLVLCAVDDPTWRAMFPVVPWVDRQHTHNVVAFAGLGVWCGICVVAATWVARRATARLFEDRVVFSMLGAHVVIWAEDLTGYDDRSSDEVRLLAEQPSWQKRHYRLPTRTEQDRVALLDWLVRRNVPRRD